MTSSDHPTPCKGPQTEEMEEETEEKLQQPTLSHVQQKGKSNK